MMKDKTGVHDGLFELTGDELNERLEAQMLAIERASILLEDAKLDPNDVLSLDGDRMGQLMELLSAYEAFLEHFRDATEDAVAAIKGLTTQNQQCCSGGDIDDADVDQDPGEWQE